MSYDRVAFSVDPQTSAKRGEHTREITTRYSRATTACEACRIRKRRCDSARPSCSKCTALNIHCNYPETDYITILESWGSKILGAVERQEQLLSNSLATQTGPLQDGDCNARLSEDNSETDSRNDTPNTPITGADMILRWPIFPSDHHFKTFPSEFYVAKQDYKPPVSVRNPDLKRMQELVEIFASKIYIKHPIVDSAQLCECLSVVAKQGIDSSASSCLITLVCALAAIWGSFPGDDVRERSISDAMGEYSMEKMTLSVPDDRMAESLSYLDLARKRMCAAYLDDSHVSVQCFTLFGHWYLYNFEPVPAWKMFRAASSAWQTYNLRHKADDHLRSEHDKSLEQRLYWTCLKSECEIRYELVDLPPSSLVLSDFPFSYPTFAIGSGIDISQESLISPRTEASLSYYFLAEISLRRLINRTRHVVRALSPDIDKASMVRLVSALADLEHQLQHWLDCLPPLLRFTPPLVCLPTSDEPELVRLVRERYVEARELLCRPFLYLCVHVPLEHEFLKPYGLKASDSLLLAMYRLETENPFFRHMGSWGSCRIRFNHALCLIAAARAKSKGLESARHVVLPDEWMVSVQRVLERLKLWSEEGAGVGELSRILEWLMQS